MTVFLNWPRESAIATGDDHAWSHAGSNLCLDFHGDPVKAGLVVYSDGNHHMALQEAVQVFLKQHPELIDVFYATTPPGVLVQCIHHSGFYLGNLKLSRSPDVFIGPGPVLDNLKESKLISHHHAFACSQGNVLLIKKNNSKNIFGVSDVLRPDVKLFLSNPETEKASYQVYYSSLTSLCEENNLDASALKSKDIVYGEKIHHREAPQAIFSGAADVAMVYYHLALRYCRIFPDEFDYIPLGGTKEQPQPGNANLCTEYHVGLINGAENAEAGQSFIDFLLSQQGATIYKSHGLQQAR